MRAARSGPGFLFANLEVGLGVDELNEFLEAVITCVERRVVLDEQRPDGAEIGPAVIVRRGFDGLTQQAAQLGVLPQLLSRAALNAT